MQLQEIVRLDTFVPLALKVRDKILAQQGVDAQQEAQQVLTAYPELIRKTHDNLIAYNVPMAMIAVTIR